VRPSPLTGPRADALACLVSQPPDAGAFALSVLLANMASPKSLLIRSGYIFWVALETVYPAIFEFCNAYQGDKR
jgi:hypothetical protein